MAAMLGLRVGVKLGAVLHRVRRDAAGLGEMLDLARLQLATPARNDLIQCGSVPVPLLERCKARVASQLGTLHQLA